MFPASAFWWLGCILRLSIGVRMICEILRLKPEAYNRTKLFVLMIENHSRFFWRPGALPRSCPRRRDIYTGFRRVRGQGQSQPHMGGRMPNED
jgi:hypothetical protein